MRGILPTGLIFLLAGTAFAAGPSVDLGRIEADVAALRAKETKDGVSGQDRLKAKYDRLKLEMLICEDGDYPAKRREMLDFLANPGTAAPEAYVNFLFANVGYDATKQRQFEVPDLLALAEKASRGNEAARLAYFTGGVRHYERMLAFDPTALDPRFTREERLAFIERALTDPLLAKQRAAVLAAKADVLRALDRKDEAEKLMRAAADESVSLALRFLPKLAEAFVNDAARFYDRPDPATLGKAKEALDRYFALADVSKRDHGGYLKACEQRARIELDLADPAEAVRWTERLVAATRTGETNQVAAVLFGDAAYRAGDWKRAADMYALAREKLPWRVREKFARALYASGRLEEARKETELAAAKAGKYKRQELRYLADVMRKDPKDPRTEALEKTRLRACRKAFMERMAAKAKELGLAESYYDNASGLTKKSRTCAADLLKIGLAALGQPALAEAWAETNAVVSIGGGKAREVRLEHVYTTSDAMKKGFAALTAKYPFLGGKGGSLSYPDLSVRAHLMVTEVGGHRLLIAISGQKYNDDPCVVDLAICERVAAELKGETPPESAVLKGLDESGAGYAYATPDGRISFANVNAGKVHAPASTTKIMTALCCLDVVKDLSKTLTVREINVQGGSGFKCHDGDTMTYRDALRAMMLPSSNTIADAVATNVGELLLKK